MKSIFFTLAILLALIAVPIVSADTSDFGGCAMGNMMYGGYGAGIMIFSWLTGILIIIGLVLFIIWMIKQLQKK